MLANIGVLFLLAGFAFATVVDKRAAPGMRDTALPRDAELKECHEVDQMVGYATLNGGTTGGAGGTTTT